MAEPTCCAGTLDLTISMSIRMTAASGTVGGRSWQGDVCGSAAALNGITFPRYSLMVEEGHAVILKEYGEMCADLGEIPAIYASMPKSFRQTKYEDCQMSAG